jgi:hypothetical protein
MATAPKAAPEISEAEKLWLSQITNAKFGPPKSTALLDSANKNISNRIESIRGGLSFTVELARDPGAMGALKGLLGPKTIQSNTGTGQAEKELDTYHHSGKLKSITPEDLQRAGQALKMISDESENAREALLSERFGEQMEKDSMQDLLAEQIRQRIAKRQPPPKNETDQQREKREEAQRKEIKQFLAARKKATAKKEFIKAPSGMTAADFSEDAVGEATKASRHALQGYLDDRQIAKRDNKPAPPLPPGVTEEMVKSYTDMSAGVDLDVAKEIWTPLVRQGAMPENLVPDRYSDVARTFKGASDAYMEQLEEYSKGLDDNSELLRKLGVGTDIAKKCGDFTGKIAEQAAKLAGAPTGIADAIKATTTVFSIVVDGASKTAEIVIKKEGVQAVFEQGATTISSVCGELIGDPGIKVMVQSSISGGMAGGRILRAMLDKDPQKGIKSFADVLEQSFSIAAAATGNNDWSTIGSSLKSACLQSVAGAKLVKAVKSGDDKAIKAALQEFLESSVDTLQGALKPAIARASGAKQADVDKYVDFSADSLKDLTKVISSDDKAGALTSAVGSIAGRSCETFIQPADLGKTIGDKVTNTVKAGTAAVQAIKDGDYKKLAGVLIQEAIDAVQTASGIVSDPAAKQALAQAASSMSLGDQAGKLAKAVIEGKTSEIDSAAKDFFDGLAKEVGKQVRKAKGEKDDDSGDSGDDSGGDAKDAAGADGEGGGDEAATEEAKKLDEKTVASLESTMKKCRAILASNAPEKDKEEAKKTLEAAAKELIEFKTMESELGAESAAFAERLRRSTGDPEDPDYEGEDTRTVQEMILQIQKDRKIFELVEKLSSMPLQIAAQFFPPTGAALDFKKFGFEVAKAVAHTQALLEWMDNAGDARSAVSVQVHAMLSRVHCEQRQVLEHNCRAAIALTAAIGQVVATVGAHAAPVGVAMTASARVAESGLELIKTVADETEMARGWAKFQKALADPRDRIVVRQAIELNPTLAKYALAWGAIKGGDPIAKNAMKKCGLTDAILSRPSANVREVQSYLQELFNEDVVILRAVPVAKKWYPSKSPVLSLRSWTAFYASAIKDADLKPGTGGAAAKAVTDVDIRLASLKSAREEMQLATKLFNQAQMDEKAKEAKAAKESDGGELKAHTASEDLKRARLRRNKAAKSLQARDTETRKSLDDFKAAAARFDPVTKSGEPHVEMREYLDALIAQADLKIRELNGETVPLVIEEAA